MIFDELGLPRDTGATDFQDSARLAGIAVTFGFPYPGNDFPQIDLSKYVVDSIPMSGLQVVRCIGNRTIKTYVRHPKEYIYDFSRDQAICLMAGLHYQSFLFPNRKDMINRDFVNGKDWFSPSHMGHVRICQGLKPRWYQKLWLWIDVCWNIWVKPMEEPNQLLCMLMVADSKYLKFWLKRKSCWREAITNYWCGWRNEPELAAHMIKVLEAKV